MARSKKFKNPTGGKKEVYPYPSPCGSHKTMIDEELTKQIHQFENGPSFVVCVDEHGSYVTEENKLDNGLCDFNRCCNKNWRKNRLDERIKRNTGIKNEDSVDTDLPALTMS